VEQAARSDVFLSEYVVLRSYYAATKTCGILVKNGRET